MSYYQNIVGQELAKERLGYQLDAAKNGREVKSIMVTGRTGLGKNAITDTTAEEFKRLGWNVHSFGCPTEMTGKVFARISEDIGTDGLPTLIKISECHRLKSRVQLTRLKRFIMLWTDEKNKGKTLNINDGELTGMVDWTRLVFVLDTNFPSQMEEGKESTSFVDRQLHVKLEDYSHTNIVKILHLMLEKKRLRVHDSTIDLIAYCARGTARPLQNITDELFAMAKASGEKETLNREQVLKAIQLAKQYPLGLTAEEVEMLQRCQSVKRQVVLSSTFPNLGTTDLRKALAFLQNKNITDMGVTRLKRKDRRNKAVANNRQAVIKQMTSVPVIRRVDVEELKKQA